MSGNRLHCAGCIIVLAALALVCWLAHPAFADKSYRITGVEIEAQLSPEGSLDVSESRTYRFNGDFSFAYRDIPTTGPVAFEGFRVTEHGRPFAQTDSEAPGTFHVSRMGGKIRITWHYRASNESRTFTFHYRARGAIERYEDAAVLYYQFLSPDWDKVQENVYLRLRPPGSVPRDQINAWLHGPLWAEYQIAHDGTILAQSRHVPARTYFEVRALYPPGLFTGVPLRAGRMRQEVMLEEARWVEEANRRREVAIEQMEARRKRLSMGKWVGIIIALAGFAVWWQIYRAYNRKPSVPRVLEMTSEIPDRTPPALVGYLLSMRQVAGTALVATLLDLGQRGYIILRQETRTVKSLWGGTKDKPEYHWDLKRDLWQQEGSSLLAYENALITFIFDDLAGGADSIPLETIKKKRSSFIKFFRDWKKEVVTAGKARQWFDERSIRGMYYSIGLAVVLFAITVLCAFLFEIWAIVPGMAAAVILVLSFLVPHRTAEGETLARQWLAVRNYLKKYEFRSADRRELLDRISDYFVYGVILGLSAKIYEELATRIPAADHGTYVPWYVYGGGGRGGFSPASFASAFSSMVTTATSTMSTASGTGGGASGGGGGGAGSGGGGAG